MGCRTVTVLGGQLRIERENVRRNRPMDLEGSVQPRGEKPDQKSVAVTCVHGKGKPCGQDDDYRQQ